MSNDKQPDEWSSTSFEGSRREQLRQAQAMTVRQRLEALDQLTQLSERMREMPRRCGAERAELGVRETKAGYLAEQSSNQIPLLGCTPTPLANYLKALGVLRLLSEQMPNHAFTASWKGDMFVLQSPRLNGQLESDRQLISEFFLHHYEPSPLVTPWNGRGGFLEGDDEDGEESSRAGAQMVQRFSSKTLAARFSILSSALQTISCIAGVAGFNSARSTLKKLKAVEKIRGKDRLSEAEKKEITNQERTVKDAKSALLMELRNSLPDSMLDWIDACLAMTTDKEGSPKSIPSPLLGAGGLDGSMDFGVNYLKRLNDVFDPDTGQPRSEASQWLAGALFGAASDGLISKSPLDGKPVSVGQFNPANAGGSNSDSGFSGDALLNPWDTLLQLEGAVLFASSVVRRLEGQGDIYASLPFTVAPRAIGGALTTADESPKGTKRRTAEMWLPLWGLPATYSEVNGIFKEGRMTLRGRTVTDGFNFARALAELGSRRGIPTFRRTAFLKRSGDAFFALDLGRYDTRDSPFRNLVEELEGRKGFLSQLQSFVRTKTPSGEWRASGNLRSLARRLDDCLIRVMTKRVMTKSDRGSLQQALILLGEIQTALSISAKAIESQVPPVPLLEHWARLADDGTPAFRIARALAGLKGVDGAPLPLRAQWFPVHPKRINEWIVEARKAKDASDDPACRIRIHTETSGNLTDTMHMLLRRRLWLAEQFDMPAKPLDSPAGATIDDINAFLQSDAMDQRIAQLLPGLCLCAIPPDVEHGAGAGVAPAAFTLLKLCLTSDTTLRSLDVLGDHDQLPVPAGLVAQLVAGNPGNRAVESAWRRLRASGLRPAFDSNALPLLCDIPPRRAAAALLIPLRHGATGSLVQSALHSIESSTEVV